MLMFALMVLGINVTEVDGVLAPGKDPQITTRTEYPLEDFKRYANFLMKKLFRH